jgi:putative molybdopterin biosynthesis protein
MKRTFRVDEVARELDVSRRTVERLIQRGQIVVFKVGASVRIDQAEIENFKKRSVKKD